MGYRWGIELVVGACLGAFVVLSVPAEVGGRSGSTPITTCTTAAVQAAIDAGGSYVFDCSGTIQPPVVAGQQVPFSVPSGDTVSLDASSPSSPVIFDGGSLSRVFDVSGGNLALVGLTVQHGVSRGAAGTAGVNGANGASGAAGTNGKSGQPASGPTAGGPGTPGSPGKSGTSGTNGSAGVGGAIYQLGGSVTLDHVVVQDNFAVGGEGAAGGNGGNGGNGGSGGFGGSGFVDDATGTEAGGQPGGTGAGGAAGGNGGKGGSGGAATGGAIYSTGSLTVTNSVFIDDTAEAGTASSGGHGGAGGAGGSGGGGGAGGSSDTSIGTDGSNAGDAGNGAAAGDAGTNGVGGAAAGGAIYAAGTLTLISVSFSGDSADGNDGGDNDLTEDGAGGGNGANGGAGGQYCGNGGDATGPGSAGDGGIVKPGGNGGKASGGAIATVTAASESNVQYSGDSAIGGPGGPAPNLSRGGQVGTAGSPGAPGPSSLALVCVGSPGKAAGSGGTPGTNGAPAPAGSNGAGTDPDYSGPAPVGLPPTNLSPPSISGTAKEGQVLTEVPGSWNPPSSSISIQWEDCDSSGNGCTEIAGETSQTYTVTIDDVGSTIRVEESATNGGVTSAPVASTQTAVVLPLPPANKKLPSISGNLTQGHALTETHGTWSNSPTSYGDQWEVCDTSGNGCSKIIGATGQAYTLTATEVGHTMRVSETAANGAGPGPPAVSAATAVVSAPSPTASQPSLSAPPTVTGTPTVGKTLFSTTGAWSGTPPPTFMYQWQRCTPGCVSITGATGSSYTLSPADHGARIRVVVTASSGAGRAVADSGEVGPVARAGPSQADIRALLLSVLSPSGKGAKIGALLKHAGYTFPFKAPSTGRLDIVWTQPHTKLLGRPRTMADLSVTFHKQRTAKLKIRLTAPGKKLLRHANALKLIATGSFTPTGENAVTVTEKFSLGQ